jgi:subtilisin family serine protease
MAGSSENLGHDDGSRRKRARYALTVAAAALLGHTAGAQLLDSTLDEVLNDAIDEQVEQQLDSEITEAIEQQVEDAVEATVETAVETVVEQQIENAVTDTIAQQVEAGVTETVQEQIESGVTGTITQQLQSTIEQVIEGSIEGVVEEELGDVLDNGLDDVLDNGLGQVVEGVGQAAERAVGGAAAAEDGAQPPTETFVAGVDAEGRAAEGQIWVILVPNEHVDRIQSWGFNVRLRRTLTGLDRVLLRVDAPEDRDIAQAALDLALDAPGTTVDFNHVYAPGADDDVESRDREPAAASRAKAAAAGSASLTIGIIDSAVATTHAAFDGAEIVQQDFVPFAAPRPLEHGTAVASILVGKNGVLDRARLHAATVFFTDGAGKPAATTESLVAALAWHAAEGVDVVNMSLAGPPNRVLETAITAGTERGMVIVAAVGNNGPVGEPLYPAAYAPVVGVTAVDFNHRIYRYANRGRHVSFAAPGVRIKVADSDGGYATESGTSMAAPYAAAIIAQACATKRAESNVGVLAALKTTAIDLGAKDFDDVFGYGLIATAEASSAR